MFPYQVWGDDGPWFSTCRSSVSGDGLFGRGFVNAALGRCPMTRRSLVNTGLAGLATFCCCSRKFAQTTAVRDLEVGSVAVINLLDQNLIAHDLNRTKCGRLQLPECCSWSPAIAADASTVAWFPTSSFPYPQSDNHQPVLIRAGLRASRRIQCNGHGLHLAVSSGAERIAMVVAGAGTQGSRLVVVDGNSGEVAIDLTQSAAEIVTQPIERLQMSGTGDHIVIGTRGTFHIIEVPSGRLVISQNGRFPSISPDGGTLAFLDEDRALFALEIANGTTRALIARGSTFGVGAWDPRGRFLLDWR